MILKQRHTFHFTLFAFMFMSIMSLGAQNAFTVGDLKYSITDAKSRMVKLTGMYYYSPQIGSVIIPSKVINPGDGFKYTVSAIDKYCFDNSAISSIFIPNTVVKIDSFAFRECSKLKSVTFEPGNKMTRLYRSAFEYCSALDSIALPNEISVIEEWAFLDCKSLKKVTLPSSINTIMNFAFRGCSSLKGLVSPTMIPPNSTFDEPNHKDSTNVSDLRLELVILDASNNRLAVDSAVVEVYKSENDRMLSANMLLRRKTTNDGKLTFRAIDFNPNDSLVYKTLNGAYYLNVYKRNLRAQEQVTLDFLKNTKVSKNIILQDATASTITVKVAIVYENPVWDVTNLSFQKSFFRTSGTNPTTLSSAYKQAMEESSGGVVQYEIVKVIDADTLFTYYKGDPADKHLSIHEVGQQLSNRDGWKVFEQKVQYDYNGMISHYGFDKMRDKEEVHEVWVVTQPFSGMYESRFMGKDAFWLNSPPCENPTCDKLLTIMFFNYERKPTEAIHSFGHRFESIMLQEYGWWDYDKKSTKSQLTNFELFTAYNDVYKKYDGNACHVGLCHHPPNSIQDYGYFNKDTVNTYAADWYNYPYVREDPDLIETVSCETWNCDAFKYLKWWYSHIPRYKGINSVDGKLNNWWYYLVNYNEAKKIEKLYKE